MTFRETGIDGAWVIEPERIEDERGFFARTWDTDEFARRGLNPGLAQCSISYNRARGTLRGMHYQVAPSEEAKLVRCTAGAVFDVVLDLLGGPVPQPRTGQLCRRQGRGHQPHHQRRP